MRKKRRGGCYNNSRSLEAQHGTLAPPFISAEVLRHKHRAEAVHWYKRGVISQREGGTKWRKLKGIAVVRLSDGTSSKAEVHWYEAHGVGRKEMKIKRLLGGLYP